MAKQLTDEEINLRRKLRHRLIGAAALMLTVAVVLPMVLDSEPKASGEDIELRIPTPDKVSELPSAPIAMEAAASATVSVGKIASAVQEVPLPSVNEAAVATVASGTIVTPPIQHVAPASAQVVSAKPTPQQAVSHETPHHETVHPNTATNAAHYAAQVGAYSNADTAQHELTQLKDWGFKAYSEKSGDKIRVRVGPYAERDKAEKVQHLLEKHGLHPAVVAAQ